MTGFIIRRLLQAIVVTLGVVTIAFGLLHALPGSLARSIIGPRASPQAIALFNRQNGLDQPLWYQYWLYVDKLAHLNLGYSFVRNQSVNSLLAAELPRDLVLGGVSLVLSLLIAVPIAIGQAIRRNGLLDYAGTGTSFLLYSMPPYAVALILIQFLAIDLHAFPAQAPQQASALGMLAHPAGLVLPVASLTLVTFAIFTRYARSSAIDTLAQDFMRTARAKGLPERLVISRHLLRNSMLTVITLVGLSIPGIITGTVVIESVFNFPGAGLQYLTSSQDNDYPVMLAITVIVGVLTVLGNLLADVSYALLDPRIRY